MKKFSKRGGNLVLLEVLELTNNSEWGFTSFTQPKPKSNRVRFLSEFRTLNKQLNCKQCPIPKLNEILLKLEGFLYATSLDLNMGYYNIRLSKNSLVTYEHHSPVEKILLQTSNNGN